ncbi:DNA repair protein RadA [Luteimicrobium subarcticum]|uniref:DNA repair protein RadA n=1 Tax=Luteimicrobium subarcticum TaxID=620910 RepID=UPI001FE879A4|nr:DNA repair protein RadA [Luteimicrobium subarcticum]
MTTTSARGAARSTARATTKTTRPAFACTECGWTTSKWVGRCGECQEWGTVQEVGAAGVGPRTAAVVPTRSTAREIAEIEVEAARHAPTGVGELDRVLGGGLVPGAVVLLAGEPGVGKSTLLLEVAGNVAGTPRADGRPRRVLYVTGEESAGQVRLRAERTGTLSPGLLLVAETDLATILGHVEQVDPDLLVVDSVQTVASAEVEGSPGGPSQVREVAGALITAAKSRDLPVVLVGHVTKDGSVAGPRTLEHLVDVVCQFEGDRHARLRMVRAVKNRYGPTDEVGCFDLSESGIVELPDPSGLFLSTAGPDVPGSCLTVALEGRRPMVLEVQALVAPSALANPRRATSGVDSSRLAMNLAVLHRHVGLRIADQDVYVSTIGGARASEPSADLAVALAVVSARESSPLPPKTVVFGEVGLAGDLRPVVGLERRLAEAVRLGYTHAVVPAGRPGATPATGPSGITVHRVASLREAAHLVTTGPRS